MPVVKRAIFPALWEAMMQIPQSSEKFNRQKFCVPFKATQVFIADSSVEQVFEGNNTSVTPMASRDHRWQFRTENAFLFFIIRIQFIFLRHRTDFCRAQRKNNFHIAIFLRLVSAQRWKNVFRIKFDFYWTSNVFSELSWWNFCYFYLISASLRGFI